MGRIQVAYDQLLNSLKARKESIEILCIDNGSTDGTQEYLMNLSGDHLKVLINDRNIGKGGSIKRGIDQSTGRYLVIHDPDEEYDAEDIWRVYDNTIRYDLDMALGSRVLGGQAFYKYRLNYWGVSALTWLINVLYGSHLTDSATAMKLIRGDLARKINWRCDGFDLDFELIVRVLRLGGRIGETNIKYYPRTIEEGKKLRAWRDGFKSLMPILRDRILPKSRLYKKIDC